MSGERTDSAICLNPYGKLQENEIRVLRLAPGKRRDRLMGYLGVVSLCQQVNYIAISYAWGEHILSESLDLPNGVQKITESLHGALRRFRSPIECVAIWADAVCINQKDEEEKSQQVALMARIFRQAERVNVWLGKAWETDSRAIWTINMLGGLYHSLTTDSDDPEEYQPDSYARLETYFQKYVTSSGRNFQCSCCGRPFRWPDPSLLEALDSLYTCWEHDWFYRLWVVQEVAVSRRCEFYCGRHHTTFDAMATAAKLAFHSYRGTLDKKGAHASRHAYLVLEQLLVAWREGKRTSYKQEFLDALINTTHLLNTSNSHDRVYALRALPFAREDERLVPDYSSPLPQLWKRLTVSLLTRPGNGNISAAVVLAMAGLQSESRTTSTACPSWVFDVDALDTKALMKYAFYSNESVLQWAGGRPPNGQAADLYAEHSLMEDDVLNVRGKVISHVQNVLENSARPYEPLAALEASLYDIAEDVRTAIVPWYLRCRNFALEKGKRYGAHLESDLDFLMVHGRDLEDDIDPLDVSWEPKLESAVTEALQNDPSLASTPVDMTLLRQNLSPLVQDYLPHHNLDATRVLASMDNGSIGWVPGWSTPGDFICLFEGAPFPFVLRSAQGIGNDYFRVLGDAFVLGIMYGEAWPKTGEDVGTLKLV